MIIRIDRDSVTAGDDLETHVDEREVDQRRPFERFVHDVIRDGYLPAIQGGRSTWVARRARRGEALAVIAIRFGRLDFVRLVIGPELDLSDVGQSLYFEYRAQEDAEAVLAAI